MRYDDIWLDDCQRLGYCRPTRHGHIAATKASARQSIQGSLCAMQSLIQSVL
ncbi:hypothetical protein [Aquirhabdus sp.]|uniref:hypothetical protein n=1 Tax=Aquirhabdus sp. TaxID=2824160 RepID=UPI00396CFCBE